MAKKGEFPYGVLGIAPKFGLREEIEFVPVFTSSNHRCKRNFTVVLVQVVKTSTLDVQNLLFFFYLLGSLPSPSPSPSLLPGFIDWQTVMNPNTFFKNACHLFTSQIIIYVFLRFGPLINCFVSPETEIWVNRQKEVRCFRKKIISKK